MPIAKHRNRDVELQLSMGWKNPYYVRCRERPKPVLPIVKRCIHLNVIDRFVAFIVYVNNDFADVSSTICIRFAVF